LSSASGKRFLDLATARIYNWLISAASPLCAPVASEDVIFLDREPVFDAKKIPDNICAERG
jgi:hypothetical protein